MRPAKPIMQNSLRGFAHFFGEDSPAVIIVVLFHPTFLFCSRSARIRFRTFSIVPP